MSSLETANSAPSIGRNDGRVPVDIRKFFAVMYCRGFSSEILPF